MSQSLTCRVCGEAKPVEAFEQLVSGGYRGTCLDCRRDAKAAAKRRKRQEQLASPEHRAFLAQRERERQEQLASPEHQALLAQRQRDKEATAALAKARAAALAKERAAARSAEKADLQDERREAARVAREERETARQDDLWSAMRRGRSLRAAQAAKPKRSGVHRIKLKHGAGYVSVAEMASRCAEREATRRAIESCKTFEATSSAMRLLEQAAPSVQRTKEMRKLWWNAAPPQTTPARLSGAAAADPSEDDPFSAAFGDWAPGWLSASCSPLDLSLAA